jgi:hypothetical protein
MKIDRSKSNENEWNMRKSEIGFKRCLNEGAPPSFNKINEITKKKH